MALIRLSRKVIAGQVIRLGRDYIASEHWAVRRSRVFNWHPLASEEAILKAGGRPVIDSMTATTKFKQLTGQSDDSLISTVWHVWETERYIYAPRESKRLLRLYVTTDRRHATWITEQYYQFLQCPAYLYSTRLPDGEGLSCIPLFNSTPVSLAAFVVANTVVLYEDTPKLPHHIFSDSKAAFLQNLLAPVAPVLSTERCKRVINLQDED